MKENTKLIITFILLVIFFIFFFTVVAQPEPCEKIWVPGHYEIIHDKMTN